jgi:hypothetical protein
MIADGKPLAGFPFFSFVTGHELPMTALAGARVSETVLMTIAH